MLRSKGGSGMVSPSSVSLQEEAAAASILWGEVVSARTGLSFEASASLLAMLAPHDLLVFEVCER